MQTIYRNEAIKQVEEAHGVKVDHILIPQIESNQYSWQSGKHNMVDCGLEHYMDADGVELGYISPISQKAFIFPNGRKWAQSFKDNARKIER